MVLILPSHHEHLCVQSTHTSFDNVENVSDVSVTDNDASYLLARLLAEDYRSQDVPPEEGPDYAYYQYGQPALAPSDYMRDVGDSYQNTQQEKLEFPELLPQQKQFAVNPSSAEFNENNPDFLQYRLEAMENHPEPDLSSKEDFQKQLVEAIDSMREEESESGPDKRGMLGQPRALPIFSNVEEENSEDFFFTCENTYSAFLNPFHQMTVGKIMKHDTDFPQNLIVS